MKAASLAAIVLALASVSRAMAAPPTEEEFIDMAICWYESRELAREAMFNTLALQRQHQSRGPNSHLANYHTSLARDYFASAYCGFADIVSNADEPNMRYRFAIARGHLQCALGNAWAAYWSALAACQSEHHDWAAPVMAHLFRVRLECYAVLQCRLMTIMEEDPDFLYLLSLYWFVLDSIDPLPKIADDSRLIPN